MQKKCKIKFVVLKSLLHEMNMFLESIVYDQPKKYALCIEIRAIIIIICTILKYNINIKVS
jgi:hypothetical protein